MMWFGSLFWPEGMKLSPTKIVVLTLFFHYALFLLEQISLFRSDIFPFLPKQYFPFSGFFFNIFLIDIELLKLGVINF